MSEILAAERVLDFCWVGAGALVTQTLALHGADVIKIESETRPDNLRVSPPFRPGQRGLNGSGYFASRNSGKRSFALNMKHPGALEVAGELARVATIVSSNYRPGVLERWGLGYADLRGDIPGLIHLSMPMQGSDGPHRDFVGFGSTIQALAGLVAPSGLPGRRPVGTGTHYPDHLPNPGHALVALLGAIYRRDHTGVGAEIELAQFESTVNMIGPDVVAASVTGTSPTPHGNALVGREPRGVYPCSGVDRWVAISADPETQPQLLEVLADRGTPHPAGDLDSWVASVTVSWDSAELVERLQAVGVAAAEVFTTADLLKDDHLAKRGFWRHLQHPEMGEIVVPGLPFQLDGEPIVDERPAPLLGQHTWEVAESVLGLSRADYDRGVRDGLFR